MSKMKIAVLGCKGTTLDFIQTIKDKKTFEINLVITLPQNLADKNQVAYYEGQRIVKFCKEHNIPTHVVNSYSLNDVRDVDLIKKEKIDLLLVIGWERLIPKDILKTLGKFACGMHGSSYGLPKGRGRSPLNWSLITNRNRFITYFFRYNSQIDSGDIIGFKVFEINEFDTILSLHLKNRIAMNQLLELYLLQIRQDKVIYIPQPDQTPSYYPKRTLTDSAIDWHMSTMQLYNLIRAVTCPYPPAFTLLRRKKISILEAYPFDQCLYESHICSGTIVDIAHSVNQFVVKTIDGSLLVKKSLGYPVSSLKIGDRFNSSEASIIMAEIQARYPDYISEDEKEV